MMNTNAAVMESPSKRKIAQATAIALLVAIVLLFTAVLPAEYGIDPLHTGKALGLTDISKSVAGSTAASAAGESAPGPALEAPVMKGTFLAQPAGYKVDSREIKLAQGDGIEIKYHLQKGAGMVYSWSVSNNELLFYEFHAEPDVKPAGAGEDYYVSYDKDDQVGKSQYHGTFIAPDTGIHGWFWENQTGVPVTLKLTTAGFYDYILRNDDNGKVRLQPSDPK